MADITPAVLSISLIAGLAAAAYFYRRDRELLKSLLVFSFPVLVYLLLHFSMEAYAMSQKWLQAPVVTYEMDVLLILIDFKVLAAVFLLFFWLHLWLSHFRRPGESRGRNK